uniref:Uncharacterized protein n=1 Tax=Syphacia muris TaxID=451379 RepID=A0A0N5A894_9BILA
MSICTIQDGLSVNVRAGHPIVLLVNSPLFLKFCLACFRLWPVDVGRSLRRLFHVRRFRFLLGLTDIRTEFFEMAKLLVIRFSHLGPCHYNLELINSLIDVLRLATSAGFSSEDV